jgi:hypothetical protein
MRIDGAPALQARGGAQGAHRDEYGTKLSEGDRWALVEYLKTL